MALACLKAMGGKRDGIGCIASVPEKEGGGETSHTALPAGAEEPVLVSYLTHAHSH